ncbi:MAG TPA: hypothetical protein VHE79_01200 [Spirochaetia bacterium]
MKKNRFPLDAFVVSGFAASFFSGFVNPLYVGQILSHLDGRIIAIGSFMSSGFPVLIGMALGNRAVFQKLYAALPVVMVAGLVVEGASALLAAIDVRAYYLVLMFIGGTFSTSVIYLLQKIKEVRYRNNRASFDRRVDMADAAGLLVGSAASVAGYPLFHDPLSVAVLWAVQTATVYGLFLVLYRKVPVHKGRHADEEPHPCGADIWPSGSKFEDARRRWPTRQEPRDGEKGGVSAALIRGGQGHLLAA